MKVTSLLPAGLIAPMREHLQCLLAVNLTRISCLFVALFLPQDGKQVHPEVCGYKKKLLEDAVAEIAK